jgi:hypothetical protein
MMFDHRSVACPSCSNPVKITRSIFRFRCPHCDASLEVSALYTRSIVLLSVLLGYAFAWEIGTLGPRFCFGVPWGFLLFWAPIGFLVLTLLVRIAPFLVKPKLVLRRPNDGTTLNLTSAPKDDTRI